MICYLKCFLFIAFIVQSSECMERRKSLPVVEALISQLEAERWPEVEAACQRTTLDMLHAVTNNTLWAVWVWDSIQLPMGSMYGAEAYLGNYDQCLDAPWSADPQYSDLRSQYCLVEVTTPGVDQTRDFGPFDDADDYYRTPTKESRYFNQHLFGVCLPSVCPLAAVGKVSRHLLQLTHLPPAVQVSVHDCTTAGETINYPTGFYVFWALIVFLMATSVFSTLFGTTDNNTFLGTIMRSFCLRRNFASLFTVGSDDLRSLHGMRFITASVLVFIHELFYQVLFPNINGLEVNKKISSNIMQSFIHIEVAVDTFFAISGLLLIKSLLMRKQINLLIFLLKRYIRLIGPYGLTIMFTTTAMLYVDRGPGWNKAANLEVAVCEKYWWKALLMLNTDLESMCNVTSWYISCDFQLAVMATLFIYVYRRNKKLGFVVFFITALTLTVHLGLKVFWKQLDIVPFNYRSFRLKREFTEAHDTYLKSHVRAGPYFVGMAMGYIMATYKPDRYRKVINKRWSIILGSVSGTVMCAIAGLGLVLKGRQYSALEAAVIVATNRTVWAIAVCCIIGLCEYGTLHRVPDVLSWRVFVPLSKLSYCLYLLHPLLIQVYKINARGPLFVNYYQMIVRASGILVVGCVASLMLYLIIEAPFINMSNMLLSKTQVHRKQNGCATEMKPDEEVQNQGAYNKTKLL